jgi:hypothetical protein
MHATVREVRRVLTPSGSAMFVLQPNSAHVGQMRSWLWEFLAWCCREWNVVQDAYWWNFNAVPNKHANRTVGLMRPSLKYCVWLGEPNCYRDQATVLWEVAAHTRGVNLEDRAMRYTPYGGVSRRGRSAATPIERGGSTPLNVLPLSNGQGRVGHGAATPLELCRWWVRYLCPPGGIVCDPFSGSGTVGVAAIEQGRRYIGIEHSAEYVAIAQQRLESTQPALPAEGAPA